jgi:RNA ligase
VEITLEKALKEIEGNKFFKVLKENDLVKVSYRFNAPQTFDTPLKRELRGITFSSKTGRVVSRPFHKFFNLGEHPETEKERLKGKLFILREKLDGTMLHPAVVEGRVRLFTQKDFANPQIEKGEELLRRNDKLLKATRRLLEKGLTPIFELISPEFQLVIPYETEELILTEVRDNRTGHYLLEEAENELIQMGFKLPRKRVGTVEEAERLIEEAENVEGFVAKNFDESEPFPLFVKIKSPWYHRAHYAFTYLHNIPDHKLFNLFLNNQADDIFATVTNPAVKEKKSRRLKVLTDIYHSLLSSAEKLSQLYGKVKEETLKAEAQKELKKIEREFKEELELFNFPVEHLTEAARLAKQKKKFDKFLGTKLYTALKHQTVKLKT